MIALLVGVGWLALSVVVAYLVGRSIQVAEAREAGVVEVGRDRGESGQVPTPGRVAGIRTVKGLPVCATAWDARGRAHLRHPSRPGYAVCGRPLEPAAAATGRSCKGCSEGAGLANEVLRRSMAKAKACR